MDNLLERVCKAVEGLSFPQLVMVEIVMNAPGPVKMTDLSTWMGKTTTAVTGLADSAEKAGWVVRNRFTSDRRKVFLSVTREGERVLGRIYERMKEGGV